MNAAHGDNLTLTRILASSCNESKRMSVTINTSSTTYTIDEVTYSQHFSLRPNFILTRETCLHLLKYVEGVNQIDVNATLASLQPRDRVRGSLCFRVPLVSSREEYIQLGSLVPMEKREMLMEKLRAIGIVLGSEDLSIAVALYHLIGKLDREYWHRLRELAAGIEQVSSLLRLEWNWITTLEYAIEDGEITYNEEEVNVILHDYREMFLSSCLSLLDDRQSTRRVFLWLGLGHFIGEPVHLDDGTSHFTLARLIQLTWCGSGPLARATKEFIGAMIKGLTATELEAMRLVAAAGLSHCANADTLALYHSLYWK